MYWKVEYSSDKFEKTWRATNESCEFAKINSFVIVASRICAYELGEISNQLKKIFISTQIVSIYGNWRTQS